jgi:hypothetical protein
MSSIGSEPKRPKIIFFRNSVTPAPLKLQPELLPIEAPHRHDQVVRATKLREVISGIKG